MSPARLYPVLLLAACAPPVVSDPVRDETPAAVEQPETRTLPVAFDAVRFDGCRAETDGALKVLTDALHHDLAVLTNEAPDAPQLDRGFGMPAVDVLRAHPHAAGCVVGRMVPRQTNVAAFVEVQAGSVSGGGVQITTRALSPGFDAALAAVCAQAGSCGLPEGTIDAELQAVLTPILWAARDVLEARAARDEPVRGADWWRRNGGNGLFDGQSQRPHPAYETDRVYLADGRGALFASAASLAASIEGAAWSKVANRDQRFVVETAAGKIVVASDGDDVHSASPHLLFVDLGGDDRYEGAFASNASGANAVSIVVDLDGIDHYEGEDRAQAAAQNGAAMLFDFGGDDDTYVAGARSQAYAQQGVAVLFDDGGDDTYRASMAAQGAAQYGTALLIDRDGHDVYEASSYAQGFGWVRGAGMLVDDRGDDTYRCDPSDVLDNPSPQAPDVNASFCQGAGFGFRHGDPDLSLAGGVGILLDGAGDDRYTAGVYAQGVGYWQGLGMLVDRAGADRYDAVWYAQGAGVHYGAGVFVDRGDSVDRYVGARHAVLGIGHDFGVGVAFEAGGSEIYALPSLAGGAASCGSVGLFVDASGDDIYAAVSPLALGAATASDDCPVRDTHATVGVMVDGDGVDTYAHGLSDDDMHVERSPEDPMLEAAHYDTKDALFSAFVSD